MHDATQNDEHNVSRELAVLRGALDRSAIVAITDKSGTIIHINDKFCEISKYPKEELLGQNHRILNSGYHSHEFFIDMWRTISKGDVWEGEIKNRAKDGKFYWVHTTIVPLLDNRARPYQYISIRFEITDRKNAEEQLRIYAAFLERSNKELQDFASIAAHDLQEPLRKIQTFADRLKAKEDNLSASGSDYLERMLASAKRMRKFIDDLLAYSSVAISAQPFQTTDLRQVLEDVMNDLEIRIEQVGATIQYESLPSLKADAWQMRQLFQNLIENALKFHRKGVAPVVQVHGRLSAEGHTLVFADNGIGFDEIYREKVFAMFHRLHGRQEHEGSGMGLAICRRIVERHRGTISAQSTPGQGTFFTVHLPLTH